MKTIIYFENDKIIIQKSSKIGDQNSEVIEIPLREGTINNGVIFDPNEIIDTLLENKANVPSSATLILDSSNIQIKRSEVPKLKKKQIKYLIEDEFSNLSNKDDLLIAGIAENRGKQVVTISYAVEHEKVRTYLDIAEAVGIKIEKIDALVNCIMKYIASKKDLKEETFVINLLKENTLISFLFEEGRFKFAGRNRLLGEAGTEYYAREIFEKLTSLMQFSKSQKMETPISGSYYLGVDFATMEAVKKQGQEAELNIEINLANKMPWGGEYDSIGTINSFSLEKGKNDINFLTEVKAFEKNEKKEEKEKKGKGFIIPVAAVVVFVLLSGTFLVWNFILSNDLKGIAEEIEANKSRDDVDIEKIEANQLIAKENSQMETAIYAIESENLLVKVDLDTVLSLAGGKTTINNIEYVKEGQMLTLTGFSDTENGTAEYMQKLRESKMFGTVSYTGYSSGSGDGYSFTITCSISGGV